MKNNCGLTLLEVLVAIVILGISFASGVTIINGVNRMNVHNQYQSNAISSIKTFLDVFSDDPKNFPSFMNDDYYFVEIEEDRYLIYFTDAYLNTKDKTDNYLEIVYEIEEFAEKSRYTLKIDAYYQQDKLDISTVRSIVISW